METASVAPPRWGRYAHDRPKQFSGISAIRVALQHKIPESIMGASSRNEEG